MTALSTPTKAELESLVTTAIYASLITARLSPASNPPSVNVTAVAPLRDVQHQSLPKMIANMTEWESRCKEVASDLEAEIARIKSEAVKRAVREKAHSDALAEAVDRKYASEAGKKSGRRIGRVGGGSKRDADDIDEDDGFFDNDGEQGSRMDIDEAPGARAGNSRQPKRVLGRKS
jgi:COP9 signalosome complex subunit 7